MKRRFRTVICGLFVTLAAVACQSDTDVVTAPPTAVPAPGTAAPTAVPVGTSTPAPTDQPTSTPAPTPTAVPPVPSPTAAPDLPGEPWDLFVPAAGEIVAVVGVAFDDILEVHEVPGELSPLVGTLAPLADDVVSAGEGRRLPASIWWRVTQGDVSGWVGSRFMSRLGVTLDLTADVVAGLGGEIPSAETMLDLGMLVATTRASTEPLSRVVVSVAPTVGELGEITIDVVGLGDDAVGGERLHIFGQPLESGEGFSLMAVEATVMCSRGVTEDGLCL